LLQLLQLRLRLVLLVRSRHDPGPGPAAHVPSRPLLAPWYRLVGDGDRLLLEHAQSLVVLEGAAVRILLPKLLPLLDGTRCIDELAERLGEPARPAIVAALELLAGRGLVVDGPDAPVHVREAAHAVAAAYGLAPAVAAERLGAASVALIGDSPCLVEVARLLWLAGVAEVRRGSWQGRGRADLTVVAPAPDELDRLPAWNQLAFDRKLRWFLLRPYDGRFASVGPLVVPGQSCCYVCMLLRRGANVGYADELADVEAAPVAALADAGFQTLVAGVAAHVAVRWVAGCDKTLPGILFTLEAQPALALDEHHVLRVPRCEVCSDVARVAPRLPWHAAEAA
jgi:bacteriocin biosynthesis cyclodehydratase domain-containing protein